MPLAVRGDNTRKERLGIGLGRWHALVAGILVWSDIPGSAPSIVFLSLGAKLGQF
jgi:hypothetical protein